MNITKVEVAVGRIAISFVTVVLTFAAIDCASVRWISSGSPVERKFTPLWTARRPMPYIMMRGTPNDEGRNALGYPGPAPARPKPPGEYRVFIVGGSTVYGGDPPLPELVEKSLRDTGRANARVYNFGVVSSISGMDLARLIYEIPDLDPDFIVMYNGGNDILHPLYSDPRPGYPYDFLVHESNPLLQRDVRLYPGLLLALYKSNILRSYFAGYFERHFVDVEKLREAAHWMSDEWKERIARGYVGNLAKAYKVSTGFGWQFLAVFQPSRAYLGRRLEQDFQEQMAIDTRNRIRAAAEEARASSGLPFADLSMIFDHETGMPFVDVIHLSPAANQTIAARIAKEIAARPPSAPGAARIPSP